MVLITLRISLGISCMCIWFYLQKSSICCLTCFLSPHDRWNQNKPEETQGWNPICSMKYVHRDLRVNISMCDDSRMLSVLSCIVSVLSRLSASMKAPVSTVSRSIVAHRSCSATDSSLHAAWDRTCRRLFTVSTMACRRQKKRDVSVLEVRDDFWTRTHIHSDIWTSQ